MLVLTRKLHEKIRIGDNITISILRVKGNSIRVGIDAPRDVRVVRGELPRFDDEPAAAEGDNSSDRVVEPMREGGDDLGSPTLNDCETTEPATSSLAVFPGW